MGVRTTLVASVVRTLNRVTHVNPIGGYPPPRKHPSPPAQSIPVG
jgi:hypothetical protein